MVSIRTMDISWCPYLPRHRAGLSSSVRLYISPSPSSLPLPRTPLPRTPLPGDPTNNLRCLRNRRRRRTHPRITNTPMTYQAPLGGGAPPTETYYNQDANTNANQGYGGYAQNQQTGYDQGYAPPPGPPPPQYASTGTEAYGYGQGQGQQGGVEMPGSTYQPARK